MAMVAQLATTSSVPRGGGYRGNPTIPKKKEPGPLAKALGAKVVDISTVRSTVPWYDPLPTQYERPAPQAPPQQDGGSTSGGGGDKEWMPVWNWDYGQAAWEGIPWMQALANLLCNARIFTPLGSKRFRPDLNHDGKSLVCPPQRTALNCAVQWDNVVDFETALLAARREAITKTANSQRSRGGKWGEAHKIREDPELVEAKARASPTREELTPSKIVLNRLLAENRYQLSKNLLLLKLQDFDLVTAHCNGRAHTYLLKEVSLAVELMENSLMGKSYPQLEEGMASIFFHEVYPTEPKLPALPDLVQVNTTEPWDIDDEPWLSETFNSGVSTSDASDMASAIDEQFLTDLLGVQHLVSMALEDGEPYHLSPSASVVGMGYEVWINYYVEDTDYHYTKRLDGATFYSIFETAYDRFSVHDRNHVLLDDSQLTDWAVNELFNLKSVGGEFNAFGYSQLLGLWYSQETSHMAVLRDTPYTQYPYDPEHRPPEAGYLEIWKWEHEYAVETLRLKHRDYLRTMAFNALEKEVFSISDWPYPAKLVPETPAQEFSLSPRPPRDDTTKLMSYWLRGSEEIQFQRWLMKRDIFNARPDEDSVAERTGDAAYWTQRSTLFFNSWPVYEQVAVPNRESLFKKVGSKLRGWANRFTSWMNEPVLEHGWAKDVARSPIPDCFEEQIDRKVVKVISERVIREKTAHDDAYDIEWLEKLTGDNINRNQPYDPVELAIQAVKEDVPKDVMSESGIYLGKEVMLPRDKIGLVLLGDTDGISTTNRISSSILDLSKVEDLGKDRLELPITITK